MSTGSEPAPQQAPLRARLKAAINSGPASRTKASFVKAAPTEKCKLKHLKDGLFQAYITNYPTKLNFTISAITTKPFTMTLISRSTEQRDIAETFTPTASYLKKSTADPGDT